MELQEELNSSGAQSPPAPQVPSHFGTDHSHLDRQLSNAGFKPVLKSCIFCHVNCSNLFQWHLANFGHLVSHVFYEHLSSFLCCLLYMYVDYVYKDKVFQCIFFLFLCGFDSFNLYYCFICSIAYSVCFFKKK